MNAEELRKLADEVEALRVPDAHYGGYLDGDPRKFEFDDEVATDAEREHYRQACAEAETMPAWFFRGETRLFTRQWRGIGLGGSYSDAANRRRRKAACALRARAAELDAQHKAA